MRVAPLGPEDVDAGFALSTAIGWNQSRADWRHLTTSPHVAAVGIRAPERLIASATVVRYGRALAWIGMVIVAPDRRGRGYGKAVFEAALESEQARAAEVVGLDATDLGAPLYAKYGFERIGAIDRWAGTARPAAGGAREIVVRAAGREEARAVAAWDHERSGVDRTGWFTTYLEEPGATALVAERRGRTVGYAVMRPGRTHDHLGPWVAEDDDGAQALIAFAGRRYAGRAIYVDALRSDATGELLTSLGLQVERRLQRRTLGGAASPFRSPPVRAAAGFEWG